MTNYRIPRGYGVNVPQYRELMEGQRPESSAIPMEAYTGLPPVQIEEIHHDPVVILPGTFVGIATGGTAAGKLFPAHAQTGTITLQFTAGDDTWGLPITDTTPTGNAVTGGPVLPLGVVYNAVYSFMLQNQFTNYKRNENVGFLTDYVIQIPAITANEALIQVGQHVMIDKTADEYGRYGLLDNNRPMGRLQAWDGTTAADLKYVVGRCIGKVNFATASTSGVLQKNDMAGLTTAGKAEFKGLERVQTVPGLGLAGSGTGGVPGWLREAVSDSSNNYWLLNILVRL